MSDIVTKEQRSKNMAAIKSKNTKPEVYLRKLLWNKGLRYRIHDKRIPGTPDIYLPKYKTAIFVNGCFWHRHPGCKMASTPKSNVEFWEKKFDANIARDRKVAQKLEEAGINQIVVWECEIRKMKKDKKVEEEVIESILAQLSLSLSSVHKD